MPIYEYRCDKGHNFEVMQRMTDDPIEKCETCSAPVQRVFHPVAVHFKGSGFYNTDYGKRKRGGTSAGSSESDSGSGSGSSEKSGSDSSEKKSDSKSDAGASKSSDSSAKTGTSSSD